MAAKKTKHPAAPWLMSVTRALRELLGVLSPGYHNVYGLAPDAAAIAKLVALGVSWEPERYLRGVEGVDIKSIDVRITPRPKEKPGGDPVLGDRILDAGKEFVRLVSRALSKGAQKKPSLDEFLDAVAASMVAVNDDGLRDVHASSEVTLSAKLAKRPVEQKYAVGDTFAIPLPDGRFAFGRIVFQNRSNLNLEIFRQTGKAAAITPEILSSGRLVILNMTGGREGFGDWRWRILGHDPAYKLSAADRNTVVYHTVSGYQLISLDGRVLRVVPLEEARPYGLGWLKPERVEERIIKALGEQEKD
jgi:hypothetical protein